MKEVKTGIYCITNKINNKKYIGQSIDIYKRWKEHKRTAFDYKNKNSNLHLYNAMRLYGIENFDFEIIEECPIEELDEKEIYYIKLFDSYNTGYNNTYGGQGANGLEIKISKEQLNQIIKDLQNSSLNQNEIAEKYNVSYTTISNINNGYIRRQPNITYPIRDNSGYKHYCPICGEETDPYSILCQKCYAKKSRKTEWPSKEELKYLIRNKPFVKIAEGFGVSDKAISKWCKYYNLPYRKREINKYTNEEWNNLF